MHAINIYITNNESMMNIHEQRGTMDSYDVHVHPIQFQLYQLYDQEYFWTFNIMKNIFEYNTNKLNLHCHMSEIWYLEYDRL